MSYAAIKIKTGDFGIVNHPVTFFQKIIAKFTHNKPHTINFVWEGCYLYVYEMVLNECKKTQYELSEYYTSKKWVLKTPVKMYNADQMNKFASVCQYARKHYTYDKDCLIRHLIFHYTNRFPVESKQDNQIVCSQLTALATNNAAPYTFRLPETISPYDCYINNNSIIVKRA